MNNQFTIEIRPATLADSEAIVRVHVTAWQESYQGIIEQNYLDFPTYICLWRVVKRYLLYKLQKPHLLEPYHNALSSTMLRYLITFNKNKRPEILAVLKRYRDTKRIVVIESGLKANDFLNDFMKELT